MSVDFIKKGAELIGSTTFDKKLLVDAMLERYLSGEVDYSIHPDQWVRELEKIDFSDNDSTNIQSVEYFGDHDTYDLEVEHVDHQFYLPNGILTSNSHAVAYAIDSYMCAWLLTHYEPEWLCTYLESMSANSEDRARAFSEAKNLGYTIKSVDINHSGREWTSLPDKTLVQSFGTIKGVGEAAVNEIMLYRPYNTIEDLLWKVDGSWKHSKFNKRVFESLIKTFSFDSMNIIGDGKLFKNYKQMHWVIIEHYDQLKKKNGKEIFYKLIKESQDIEDWSFNEKIEMQLELIGDINVLDYINPDTLQKLKDKGVESLSETEFEESVSKICWFLVMSSKDAKTKNGKQYTQLSIVGSDGKQHKVFAWNIINSSEIPCGRAYVAELEKTQFGLSLRGKKIKELL